MSEHYKGDTVRRWESPGDGWVLSQKHTHVSLPEWTLVNGPERPAPMTMRDQFAMSAVPEAMKTDYGLDWGYKNANWPERVARRAYLVADEMMKAREKPSE
jgi:hypothetical protein